MAAPRKYPDELRERATRMVVDPGQDPATKAGWDRSCGPAARHGPRDPAQLGPTGRDRRRRPVGHHDPRSGADRQARAGEPRDGGLLALATKHAAPTADAVIDHFNELAQTMKASLAWDQGSETAQHTSASLATATPVFFADPHSPWQRPSNENTNRLHQEYLPTGVPKSLRPRMPQQVVHGRRPRPHGASDRLAQPGDSGTAATRERLLLGDARCTHCIEGHPIPALTPELAGHGAWFDARRCLHGTVHGAQSGGQA